MKHITISQYSMTISEYVKSTREEIDLSIIAKPEKVNIKVVTDANMVTKEYKLSDLIEAHRQSESLKKINSL